ncbi:MAG: O-methyltransferase [Phycisphaerales bacterium]|nr:MAG: O-methyltransferase [Phycisphaerales bacterium]
MLKKMVFVILLAALVLVVAESLTAQPPGRGFGGRRGMGPRMGSSAALGQPPLPVNEEEKKILSVLEDMRLNQGRGMMNVPKEDGRILRMLTEAVGAKHVVEIGTSNGYSGIWFCLALRTTGGKLTTHDIDERRAALARENFKRAGVDQLVTLVMGDAHETVTKIKQPIDILFIDADKEGYTDYLNKLLPLVRPGGLILSHNIDSTGRDFIDAITKNPNLDTTQAQGVTITLKKRHSS